MSAVTYWRAEYDAPPVKALAQVIWVKATPPILRGVIQSECLGNPAMLATPTYDMIFPVGGRGEMLRAIACVRRAASRRGMRLIEEKVTNHAPTA